MPRYIFSLNEIHVITQRSEADEKDADWLYFAVKVNDVSPFEITGPITTVDFETFLVGPGPAGERSRLGSGSVLRSNSCQIGPIEVGPEDTVLVVASVINLGSTDDDQQAADFLKFAGASAELVGRAVGLVSGGLLAVAGEIVNELGSVVSAIGEVLGWFTAEKNCNGLVFVDANGFTGKRLRDLTQTTAHINPTRGHSQFPQEGCGVPQTEVTLAIRDSASLRQCLQARGLHPNPGIRSLTSSVRELMR
jgi:hypothetical protein